MLLPIHHSHTFADKRARLVGMRRDSRDAKRWRRENDPLNERRPIHTAYHEAGHTILGQKLGIAILAARCDPHGRTLTERSQQLDAIVDIVLSLAGGVAERRRILFGDFEWRDSIDRKQIRATLRLMSKSRRAQRLIRQRAELVTRGLVTRYWREIDAFARLLYKRGHVRFA